MIPVGRAHTNPGRSRPGGGIDMARKKLVIIDGNSLANRAFYAIQADLSTKSGERTNAVYGFANMLLRLIDEEKPDLLAVAFDLPWRSTGRRRLSDISSTTATRRPERACPTNLLRRCRS